MLCVFVPLWLKYILPKAEVLFATQMFFYHKGTKTQRIFPSEKIRTNNCLLFFIWYYVPKKPRHHSLAFYNFYQFEHSTLNFLNIEH